MTQTRGTDPRRTGRGPAPARETRRDPSAGTTRAGQARAGQSGQARSGGQARAAARPPARPPGHAHRQRGRGTRTTARHGPVLHGPMRRPPGDVDRRRSRPPLVVVRSDHEDPGPRGPRGPRRPLTLSRANPRRRARVMFVAILFVFTIFAGQLLRIQAFDASATQEAALFKRSVRTSRRPCAADPRHERSGARRLGRALHHRGRPDDHSRVRREDRRRAHQGRRHPCCGRPRTPAPDVAGGPHRALHPLGHPLRRDQEGGQPGDLPRDPGPGHPGHLRRAHRSADLPHVDGPGPARRLRPTGRPERRGRHRADARQGAEWDPRGQRRRAGPGRLHHPGLPARRHPGRQRP